MRAVRPAGRRRRHRALRVVAAGRAGAERIGDGLSGATSAGLEGARLLQAHFPDFWDAEGVAQLSATLPQLLGCCAAFWHLIDREAGLPLLRWPEDDTGEMTPADTPDETLRCFDGATEEWMATSVAQHIVEPRPHYWGFGVESLMDEWSGDMGDVLAIALWHLFDHTPWSLGVELSEVIDDSIDLEPITRLRPLAGDAPVEHLVLTIPEAEHVGVPAGEVLRYPFGRCANDLANHTDYEIDAIYYGEYGGPLQPWDWDDLPALIAAGRQAQRIERAYVAWRDRVLRNPARELPMLAAELRAAAREAAATHAAPLPLAELLGAACELDPIGTDAVPEELAL